MARFSVEERSTGAGSATLPLASVYSGATGGNPHLREVGIFNTTAVACTFRLVRLTTTGTQGAALTEMSHEAGLFTSLAQGFNTHTVGPTITAGGLARAALGAAIGSGMVWTFGGETGLAIPVGTGNGVGIVAVGTGQIVDFYFVWDE